MIEKLPSLPGNKSPLAPGKTGQLERLDAKSRLKKAGNWVRSGWENVVTSLPNKADIYAYSFRTADEGFHAKEIYYIHRILKTLFPTHFPKIRAALEHTPQSETPGGTVREKVNIVPPEGMEKSRRTSFVYWFMQNFITKTTNGDFQEVRKALLEMGIKDGIDYNPPNFGIDETGHEQYLDTAPGLAEPFIKQSAAVLSYMATHGYARDQIAKVKRALRRLTELVQSRKEKK